MAAVLLGCIAALTSVSAEDHDAVQYWTDYAIEPKRCIRYNGADMIMFSMFESGYNHCTDAAIGTYVTTVPDFVDAYVAQLADNEYDTNADDAYEYEDPNASAYKQCVYKQVAGVDYYVMLGCSDSSPLQLAVNIYTDADCTERSVVDGYDDSNIQVDINLNFKKCLSCVPWSDKNDDEIDDAYYENKQQNAPLCSTVWDARETCNSKCQLISMEKKSKDGWNKADKILLSILSVFGFGMLGAIVNKRQTMSNKDALLEQAAMSAAGLQQSHVIGIFALVIVVVLVFALLGLKKITWALLLIMNIVLFGYLMKLTVDGSVKDTIVGPDGKIVEKPDSDDEASDGEDEEAMSPTSMASTPAKAGTYENPELPPVT